MILQFGEASTRRPSGRSAPRSGASRARCVAVHQQLQVHAPRLSPGYFHEWKIVQAAARLGETTQRESSLRGFESRSVSTLIRAFVHLARSLSLEGALGRSSKRDTALRVAVIDPRDLPREGYISRQSPAKCGFAALRRQAQ